MIDQAGAVFDAVVKADGALLPGGGRCYFAPGVKTTATSAADPRMACGPVFLGISGTDRPWVVGRVAYSTASAEEVTGRFDAFRTVESLDGGTLRRPDGQRPPRNPKLGPSTEGVRDEDGKRLLGADEMLSVADPAFLRAAADAKASVNEGSRCHFGITPNRNGQRISDGKLWCGPVLLLSSEPSRSWASFSLRTTTGQVFGTAEIAPVTVGRLSSTIALPPGIELYRPDGKPASQDQAILAPDAPARPSAFTEVLTSAPALNVTTPLDGRLAVPGRILTLTGLARAPKIGSGREAVVAAAGEDLVVATFTRSRPDNAPTGGEGTAVVVVDAARRPLPRWTTLPEEGVLVVSVPQAARTVDLEVLFEGRAQTISLLTGSRAQGAPAALYRRSPSVGIGQSIDVTVTLAAGQVVRTRGTATETRMEAWRKDDGWAPAGKAWLSVVISGWTVDRPCCALSRVETTPVWRMVLPDGTTLDALSRGSASSGSANPAFAVPETFTEGRVELVVNVRFEASGRQGDARSDPVLVAVRVPA